MGRMWKLGTALGLGGLLIAACSGPETAPAETDPYLAEADDGCLPDRRAMNTHKVYFDTALTRVEDAPLFALGALQSFTETGRAGGKITSQGITLAGGYFERLKQGGNDPFAILRIASRDVEAENRQIDALLSSFDRLVACRKAQGADVQERYRAGQIELDDAQAQMATVRRRYDEDVARFREISRQVTKNTEAFSAVYNDIAADNGGEALEVKPFVRGTPSAVVEPRPAVKKAGTPVNSLKVVSAPAPEVKPEVQRLQNELLTNVRKRDAVIERVERAADESPVLDLA